MNVSQEHRVLQFAVIVERDEDGFFVVECPTLPGCVSQGTTEEEALENIREAIGLWLEVEAEKQAQVAPQGVQVRQVAV